MRNFKISEPAHGRGDWPTELVAMECQRDEAGHAAELTRNLPSKLVVAEEKGS